MINLEPPSKLRPLVGQAHQVAMNLLRPNSRRYDGQGHSRPKEMDMLAAMVAGLAQSGASSGAGAAGVRRDGTDMDGVDSDGEAAAEAVRNGAHLASVLSVMEMCWGDVGLLLSMPRQGLGNAAIASLGDAEQRARFDGRWASMAITEPGCGSDSASITTTAVRDGDAYVINGEKIFVTAGDRSDAVVVWATLDKSLGRAAIKAFVVPKGTPGMTVERLEDKLGIRASDTATLRFQECRVPKENLLGSPEVDTSANGRGGGFAGAMATFDNTRPVVAAMAVGCARASLELTRQLLDEAGVDIDYDRPALAQSAAAATFLRLESDWEAAYLLTLQAAWMADNRRPNSLEASIAKAKAGRAGSHITLRCVELAGSLGYSEHELLEKWARDSKILDIFEGTQQIQQLIVARRLLGLSSAQLK
jgi:acyl-CoA dehydrogenase